MWAFTSLYCSLNFAKGKVSNLSGLYLKICRCACKNSAEALQIALNRKMVCAVLLRVNLCRFELVNRLMKFAASAFSARLSGFQ